MLFCYEVYKTCYIFKVTSFGTNNQGRNGSLLALTASVSNIPDLKSFVRFPKIKPAKRLRFFPEAKCT